MKRHALIFHNLNFNFPRVRFYN